MTPTPAKPEPRRPAASEPAPAAAAKPAPEPDTGGLLDPQRAVLKVSRNRPEDVFVTFHRTDGGLPQVRVERAVFEDMRRPDMITVEIRPGDHLNQ